MFLTWVLYVLAVGVLLALAAGAAEQSLRAVRLPARFVWATSIALTVAFAALSPFRRDAPREASDDAWHKHRDTAHSGFVGRDIARIVPSKGIRASDIQLEGANSCAARSALAALMPERVNRLAVGAAVALSVIGLLVLAATYATFAARRRRWPQVRLLGHAVRISPDIGPAAMGVAPAEIVVPQWILSRNETEQRLVLRHESEHVRARDPLLLLCACLATALLPWHIAVWYMWSRLTLAVELDCDQRVIRRGAGLTQYGTLLIDLSARARGFSWATPGIASGNSHLEKRLVAMTSRLEQKWKARAMGAGMLLGAALLVRVRRSCRRPHRVTRNLFPAP